MLSARLLTFKSLTLAASLVTASPVLAITCGDLAQVGANLESFPKIAAIFATDGTAYQGLAPAILEVRDTMLYRVPPTENAMVAVQGLDALLEENLEPKALDSEILSAWALFRLRYVIALSRTDCISLATMLLEDMAIWPLQNETIKGSVSASLTGAYITAGRLNDAQEIALNLLSSASSPEDLDGLRVRLAALNNLAVALRQGGARSEARSFLQRARAVADASKYQSLVEAGPPELRHQFWEDLATLEINFAALTLYQQDGIDNYRVVAKAHLNRAKALLEKAGVSNGRRAIDRLRVLSDLALENRDRSLAEHLLNRALALAENIAANEQSLLFDLRSRLSDATSSQSELIEDLLGREDEFQDTESSTALDRIKNAGALLEAYTEQGDWQRAVRWGRIALDRSLSSNTGATIERALTEQKLSFALANAGQMSLAFDVSKQAMATLRGIASREAVGCLQGTEINRPLLRTIREWHGIVSSTVLESVGDRREIEDEVADEVFGLIQSQEADRVGASALRAALRNQAGLRDILSEYESLQTEKCELETELASLASTRNAPQGAIASLFDKIAEKEARLAALAAELDPVASALLKGGRATLSRNDLKTLLSEGEAILGFQFGEHFSVASFTLKRNDNVTTATIPLPDAPIGRLDELVSSMLSDVETHTNLGDSAIELSQRLRLPEITSLLSQAQHVFVVADGPLLRIPSHLLPVAERRLGEFAATSSLPSTWAFALRRELGTAKSRTRNLFGIGDPLLFNVPCFLIDHHDTDHPHRDVMCLGIPGGLSTLLNESQSTLNGPPPLLRRNATLAAVRGDAATQAGVLLFGTHGVVPGTGEVEGLVEPALVLTPDRDDPAEDGLLRASEISSMSWDNGWLAILAACRTGTPSTNEVSDGLAGFALAFTSAGVEALLVTQWAVPADPASEVVLSTLKMMASDPTLTLSAALEQAMREQSIRTPRLADWSAFTILGDGNVTMPAN